MLFKTQRSCLNLIADTSEVYKTKSLVRCMSNAVIANDNMLCLVLHPGEVFRYENASVSAVFLPVSSIKLANDRTMISSPMFRTIAPRFFDAKNTMPPMHLYILWGVIASKESDVKDFALRHIRTPNDRKSTKEEVVEHSKAQVPNRGAILSVSGARKENNSSAPQLMWNYPISSSFAYRKAKVDFKE